MGNVSLTLKKSLVFAGIFAIAAALRLYNLEELPGEWYSDISIVDRYVSGILALNWPIGFDASAGPLYHYLVAPAIALFDHRYLTYKLASTIMGLAGIGASMLLAYEIGGLRLSYLTGFVSGISSWLLIFSRLGNSQIILPILTGLAGYFLVRYARKREIRDALVGAIISALGLYTYPQTFILPPAFLLVLAICAFDQKRRASGTVIGQPNSPATETSPDPCLQLGSSAQEKTLAPGNGCNPRESRNRSLRHLLASFLIVEAMALPFLAIALRQPDNFRTGYIGEKLFGAEPSMLTTIMFAFAENLAKSLLMFHVRGDYVFRSNPPFLPHLDPLSGSLLFLGIGGLAATRRWRALGFLLGSTLLLLIPGSWPFILPGEVPSASRAIGVVPFVYILVAYGLSLLYDLLRKASEGKRDSAPHRFLAPLVVAIVLASIMVLNIQRYFVTYAWHLPDHNVAFGRIIAQKIDTLPSEAEVFVVGGLWGEWGQPDFDGILHQLKAPRPLVDLPPQEFNCNQVWSSGVSKYFFWDPRDEFDGFERLRECLPGGEIEKRFTEDETTIYLLYRVEGG